MATSDFVSRKRGSDEDVSEPKRCKITDLSELDSLGFQELIALRMQCIDHPSEYVAVSNALFRRFGVDKRCRDCGKVLCKQIAYYKSFWGDPRSQNDVLCYTCYRSAHVGEPYNSDDGTRYYIVMLYPLHRNVRIDFETIPTGAMLHAAIRKHRPRDYKKQTVRHEGVTVSNSKSVNAPHYAGTGPQPMVYVMFAAN